MMDLVISVISFIGMVLIMVTIHEWGHFYFARFFKVKVDVFAVGFGKTIWSRFDKYGTEWKINLLPLGGYVKMFGDAGPASNPDNELLRSMTQEEKEKSFFYKKLWQKGLIVFAGPLMNYLLAFVVMIFLTAVYGDKNISNKVGAVEEQSPAAKAGIIPGDTIISVNNKEIQNFIEIREVLDQLINSKKVPIIVNRNGEEIQFLIEPVEIMSSAGGKRYKIGVVADIVDVHYSLGESVIHAAYKIYFLNSLMVDGIGKLLSGNGSTEELGGPIKIAQISGEAARSGIQTFLGLLVLLSINLGLVNLLPIPGLDGGHLMYYTLNAVSGRPLPQKIQELGFKLGFLALISLLVFVTYNDILNLLK